jgi:prevent-host-death family protein
MEQEKASIAQARNTLSALINSVAYGKVRVVLESRGKPKAALVSMEDLNKLERMEQEREIPTVLLGTLAQARTLRERILARRKKKVADSAHVLEQLRGGRVGELSGVRRRQPSP